MHKPNILVVDDTPANLEYLEEILDDAGYETRVAKSGEAAIRSIQAQVPNLILLDIMMPGIDGYETCRLLKEDDKFKDVPVIFLSAKGETMDKVKAFDLGAVDYLTKPFEAKEILVRIKTHLSIHFLQKDLEEKINIIDKHVITSKTDLNGVITEASEAFSNISGYSKQELLGKKHNILRHEDTPDELYTDMWTTIIQEEIWQGEIKNKSKQGYFYWVDAVISPSYDARGNHIGYTSIRHNITDQKNIEQISITDSLTGLNNRRHFNTIFPAEIKQSIRHESHLAFFMMDVDFFKQYNDIYGHQDGDHVLSSIGKTLIQYLHRDNDYTFRLGGEEFGVLCSIKNCDKAEAIAQGIRQNIEELGIEHSGNKASKHLTISIGVICIDFSKKAHYKLTVDELYKLADDELYKAKEHGRNQVSMQVI